MGCEIRNIAASSDNDGQILGKSQHLFTDLCVAKAVIDT